MEDSRRVSVEGSQSSLHLLSVRQSERLRRSQRETVFAASNESAVEYVAGVGFRHLDESGGGLGAGASVDPAPSTSQSEIGDARQAQRQKLWNVGNRPPGWTAELEANPPAKYAELMAEFRKKETEEKKKEAEEANQKQEAEQKQQQEPMAKERPHR